MVGMSTDRGGVESYIANLAAHLNSEEFQIVYDWPEIIVDGVIWKRPANRHNYFKWRQFWTKFFQTNHFDCLYMNACDIVSIDLLRFGRAAGIPVRILHSHSSGIQQGITQGLSLFHRICEWHSRKVLHKYATHLLACSQVAGEWMFDGRPFQIIKNGIDLDKYAYHDESRSKCRGMFNIDKDVPLIGCIGRLDPPKNPLRSVEIAKKILLMQPDAEVVFVGDGEMRSAVRQKVAEAGLENKILFAGAVDNVNEWMSAVDCLMMPSLFEGLPFVLVEAQAAGLSCIVSSAVSKEADLTGLLKFISLEASSETWAKEISAHCSRKRPDTRRQLAEAGYSIKDSVKAIEKIFQGLESYGLKP